MKKLTQNQRVLAALRAAGARGITSVDFMPPNVLDGDKPILRLAARVGELRDADIDVRSIGERDGVTVYALEGHEPPASGTVHRLPVPAPIAPPAAVVAEPDDRQMNLLDLVAS